MKMIKNKIFGEMNMCISVNELNARVAEVRSLKALREETENAIKALERDIIGFMTEHEKPEYIGTNYKVTYERFKYRNI